MSGEGRRAEAAGKADGRARELAAAVDFGDPVALSLFGVREQRRLAEASAGLLERMRQIDLSAADEDVGGLLGYLQGWEGALSRPAGLFGRLFGGGGAARIRAGYEQARLRVERLAHALDMSRLQLLRSLNILEALSRRNAQQLDELALLIEAGGLALAGARAAGGQEEAADRFEARLHDLALSRAVGLQQAAQLSLVQEGHRLLIDRLQQTLELTIPLWLSQMAIALGLEHQRAAARLLRPAAPDPDEIARANRALSEALRQGLALQQSARRRAEQARQAPPSPPGPA